MEYHSTKSRHLSNITKHDSLSHKRFSEEKVVKGSMWSTLYKMIEYFTLFTNKKRGET